MHNGDDAPELLGRLRDSWSFYRTHLRLCLSLAICGVIFIFIGVLLFRLSITGPYEQILISLGVGLVLAGSFNTLYQAHTREVFRGFLSEVVPTLSSGIVVFPDHRRVISRGDAIERYLKKRGVVRIITSTADNYVRCGEPARQILETKIREIECSLRILLYLPVYEYLPDSRLGQHLRSPQQLINNQRALMDDYESMIALAPDRVAIKCFTLPLHINFIMIGDEKMYSAPILHTVGGLDLPCFEISPVGPDSLFNKFKQDFDSVFYCEDKRVCVPLACIRRFYEQSGSNWLKLRELFFQYIRGN